MTDFKDLYHMTVEDNIAYAKRNIVDLIYKSARLEGLAVTFAQTEEIYYKGIATGLDIMEILAVNNLKNAWKFIFETIDYPIDLMYIRQLNKEIGASLVHNAGDLREDNVSIGGTTWKPTIPDYATVEETVNELMQSDKTITEKAILMFLYICRQQLFYDEYLRTATLAANQMLIANGNGILSIPEELDSQFKILLVRYYETNDAAYIKEFLYDYCLGGYKDIKTTQQPKINREMFYNHKTVPEENKASIFDAVRIEPKP